jgi:hypothetical protein
VSPEVIRPRARNEKVPRILGVIPLVTLWLVGLAFLFGQNSGVLERTVLAPGAFLLGLISFGALAWGVPWYEASWSLEIRSDAVCWRRGFARGERVVRRWQVLAVRCAGRRPSELSFHDATGRQVGAVPVARFPVDDVLDALRRNDWPDPATGTPANLKR